MRFTDIVYNKYYPPTIFNRHRARIINKNRNFSLLCANCMGGYMYHQLGIQFQSPTINLMMSQPDFYSFISNLDSYLSKKFIDISVPGSVPIGLLDNIKIHFTHYRSFAEATTMWEKRADRINYENLYIICTDRDGITPEDIRQLQNIKCKKLICFTAQKYDYPYCFQIEEFVNQTQIGNILRKNFPANGRLNLFLTGWNGSILTTLLRSILN